MSKDLTPHQLEKLDQLFSLFQEMNTRLTRIESHIAEIKDQIEGGKSKIMNEEPELKEPDKLDLIYAAARATEQRVTSLQLYIRNLDDRLKIIENQTASLNKIDLIYNEIRKTATLLTMIEDKIEGKQ